MTVAKKRRIRLCKEEGCHNAQTTGGLCRLHYLRNWKAIKEKQQKAAAERLNKYVERMTKQFPDRYVDEIKKDLRSRQFEKQNQTDDDFGDTDEIYRLFNDPEFADELNVIVSELHIEREF